jgi:hypothetical protein
LNLLEGNAVSQQNGVEDKPAIAGEIVTMGTRSLASQAMRAEQAEFSADCGGTLASLRGRRFRLPR